MKLACPRLFEAEALRDGRLAGAEVASFQRHLSLCAHCSREVAALEALAQGLRRESATHADTDELHVRRERTRLLAAFDASLVPVERRSGQRWWPGLAAAFAVLSGIFLYLSARRPTPPTLAASAIVVRADSTAVWSKQRNGSLETVRLERGALSIHVDHAVGRQRLLVQLPDGELEDIGTTFAVSADAGRTTRVTVQDGSVVLRIHGQPPLALGAGDSWSPSPRPSASCASCQTLPAASSNESIPSLPAAPTATPRPAPFARSVPASPPSPAASTVAADPALDFRVAMAALASGDNAAAATRFTGFLTKHPRDRRAEDAAYLRVIALQRAGDGAGMKHAAIEYLRRFPRGFRHAEVERLAR